ncbi:hypothetical protein [Sporosarcina sp. FSL W7-1283]|uniref:hypothetical protein n=1 Tax=Sporosarcina sp. FSL W7-1283 TaxID=2921560 RepID=UPI0030F87728
MFNLDEKTRRNLKELQMQHEKYMEEKYGKEFMSFINGEFEVRLTESLLKQFEDFAEVKK